MLKGLRRYRLSDEMEDEAIEDEVEEMGLDRDVNAGCIVTGHVGRWDGVHEIVPRRFGSATDCFRFLVGAWYDGIYVLERTGRWTFRFTAASHDDPTGRTRLKIAIDH